jgi:hypothetical protein
VATGTILGGLCAWALGGPLAGFLVALAVLLAMKLRHGRLIALATGAFLMAAGALEVLVHQERYRYPPGGWPTHFDRASTIVWAAVLILGAEAALEAVRRIRAHTDEAGASRDNG